MSTANTRLSLGRLTLEVPTNLRAVAPPLAFSAFLSFGAFALYYFVLKQGQPTLWPGSFEYSQVARNIVTGQGLTTNSATVLEYWFLSRAGLPLPYFFHDVGNSLIISFFFRILGANQWVIGVASGAFFVLLGPLTFLLGSRLVGRRAALIATILCTLNAELLIYSVTGHSEVPFAFFLTLFLLLLYGGRSSWMLFASGIVFGWLIVLRSNSLPFLPWVMLFIFLDPREDGIGRPIRNIVAESWRKRRAAFARVLFFAFGVAVLFIPNAVRNYGSMGSPLYNVNSIYSLVWYTSAIQGKSQEVFSSPGLAVEPMRYILAHPAELASKMQYQLSRTADHLLTGVIYPGNWQDSAIILLFILALIAPPKGESDRRRLLRLLLLALIVTALVVGSAFNIRWRHLYGFLPIALVLIADLLDRLLWKSDDLKERTEGLGRLRPYLSFFVVLLFLLWGASRPVLANVQAEDSAGLDYRFRLTSQMVEEQTPESAVILTQAVSGPIVEIQNALAWYTGRQYVQYSDYTVQHIEEVRAGRPIYLLLAAADPSDPGLPPANPKRAGFEIVATQRDSAGKLVAVLMRAR